MQTLLTNLQSPDVHRNIKPQILSAFGDIALAIGDKFEVRGCAGGCVGVRYCPGQRSKPLRSLSRPPLRAAAGRTSAEVLGCPCPPAPAALPGAQKYMQHVVAMLQSAMGLSVQQAADEDAADYNNTLRHGAWRAVGAG